MVISNKVFIKFRKQLRNLSTKIVVEINKQEYLTKCFL